MYETTRSNFLLLDSVFEEILITRLVNEVETSWAKQVCIDVCMSEVENVRSIRQ